MDGKPVVWSIGKDQLDGTTDDIILNSFEYERKISDFDKWNIRVVLEALDDYKFDCGIYPTQEHGLNALSEYPGVDNWRGPYVDYGGRFTDSWGNPLRYNIVDGKPVVWGIGRDQEDGTVDDIYPEDTELESVLFDPNQE